MIELLPSELAELEVIDGDAMPAGDPSQLVEATAPARIDKPLHVVAGMATVANAVIWTPHLTALLMAHRG